VMSLKGAVLCRCTTKRDCSIGLNCHHVFDPSLPFGGYKQSGWGRETGRGFVELPGDQSGHHGSVATSSKMRRAKITRRTPFTCRL
jgi:hypothetical protein